MTPAEIIRHLLSEGYPLATIAKQSGIKERYLASYTLSERDQVRLERYAQDQPCLRGQLE